jgi:cobyrinic acid a,c-diamide synthase
MQSSDGKTAVTCMLLAALRARGVPVQPFKVGPDFIDPGYHSRIAGVTSRNLDAWLMGDDGIIEEVLAAGRDRVSIVEGVMGLFDGSDARSDEGSTMALARLLDRPVVLVVMAKKSGRSLAVALRGFVQEAGLDRIAGVILNGVSGNSHTEYLREAIQPLAVPVLGALPCSSELAWQEYQLPSWQALASLAEQHLDISAILELARRAVTVPQLPPCCVSRLRDARVGLASEARSQGTMLQRQLRVGVATDEAFHFYYQANLDYLTNAGVQLITFSPLHDSALPADLDALFIGGGFPEIFASQLAGNSAMRAELRSAIQQGLNCYAECGGLMLLAEELITLDQKVYPMAGVIPGAVQMTKSLKHFGYCVCSEWRTSSDQRFRGHEFHHSVWSGEPQQANLWSVQRKRTGGLRREGFFIPNLHASYVHLHFRTSGSVMEPFLNRERSL